MDFLFWVIMLAVLVWHMYDGGIDAIDEWRWLRQARREIKMMEAGNDGVSGSGSNPD